MQPSVDLEEDEALEKKIRLWVRLESVYMLGVVVCLLAWWFVFAPDARWGAWVRCEQKAGISPVAAAAAANASAAAPLTLSERLRWPSCDR